MKLSEAIRIGAKKRPQGFGHYIHNGLSCAIGAAMEAKFGRAMYSYDVSPIWPELDSPVPYPAPGKMGVFNLFSVILCLNDDARWTREKIADWVESLGY